MLSSVKQEALPYAAAPDLKRRIPLRNAVICDVRDNLLWRSSVSAYAGDIRLAGWASSFGHEKHETPAFAGDTKRRG